VTPHVLRHTSATELLQHGVDRSVIALWLGHESVETTQMYLHADMRLKVQALARTAPVGIKPGRYRANDQLLAFLTSPLVDDVVEAGAVELRPPAAQGRGSVIRPG
jgi:hypothetical protein